MNKKQTWLVMIFCAFAFTATGQALQSPENKWEPEIKKFEESDRQNPPPASAVLFIGSSSIQKWKSLADDFPGTKVINRGFGGSEIADSTFLLIVS